MVEPADLPLISYGDLALLLGSHLALAVKERIWRGEYMDIFSLIQVEPEPVPKLGEPVRNQEFV